MVLGCSVKILKLKIQTYLLYLADPIMAIDSIGGTVIVIDCTYSSAHRWLALSLCSEIHSDVIALSITPIPSYDLLF